MQHTLHEHTLNYIRGAINSKGLTQSDVAKRMDLSRQMVANYLTGRTEITINTLERFCRAVGVPVSEIFNTFDKLNKNTITVTGDKNTSNQGAGAVSIKKSGQQKHKINKLKDEIYYLKKINATLENQVQDKYKQIDKQDMVITRCWEQIDRLENELNELKT